MAGGCFWGMQEYFSRIPGVVATTCGYVNGSTENPTYEEVCHANTGHAETVRVTYDPAVVDLRTRMARRRWRTRQRHDILQSTHI